LDGINFYVSLFLVADGPGTANQEVEEIIAFCLFPEA